MILLNGEHVIPTIFPDGTSQVWKIPEECIQKYNRLIWSFDTESEIIHLQQLSDLLNTINLRNNLYMSSVLDIPYLPYARQDKNIQNNRTFALKSLSFILGLQSWSCVNTFDPHSEVSYQICERLIPIYPNLMFAFDYDTIIFPDKGAHRRYPQLHRHSNQVIIEKQRSQETGNLSIRSIEGQPVGRSLVVDDLCDGGGTFCLVAKELLKHANIQLHLYVSHGIFSKGLRELLKFYNKIITTDSFRWSVYNRIGLKTAARQNLVCKEILHAIEEGRLEVKPCIQ